MENNNTQNDGQYFIMGNNRIIIKEHFKNDGKSFDNILEKVILDAEKTTENQLKH